MLLVHKIPNKQAIRRHTMCLVPVIDTTSGATTGANANRRSTMDESRLGLGQAKWIQVYFVCVGKKQQRLSHCNRCVSILLTRSISKLFSNRSLNSTLLFFRSPSLLIQFVSMWVFFKSMSPSLPLNIALYLSH